MKALILRPQDGSVKVEDVDPPTPGPTELLIRVSAVALNPIDWIYVAHPTAKQEQRVVGTDFAGTVVGRGDEVNDEGIKIGARVAGFLQGACSTNDRPGAFAEYITIDHDLVWSIPDQLSLEQAASVSMCGLTAAQGVFGRLGMPCPFSTGAAGPGDAFQGRTPADGPVNCLIYGSSTSLGLYVAQLVKLVERTSGQRIRLIGAASSSKHGLLRQKPYSYDVLVDYRDENWPEKVRAATDGKGVDFAMDCISEGVTVEKVESTFGPSGGRFAVIRAPQGGKYDPSQMRVKPVYGAVWEGLGVEIGYNGLIMPANPRARVFAAEFYQFLGSGAIRGEVVLEPNPVRIMPGGLDRIVPDGFTLLGSLRVSDRGASGRTEDYMRPISMEKLVYSLV
ncbi:GroES-like protein [Hypoxylon sp. FL0890]|nr:GroES-like protein [Hypoxylon sp. FL0890]